MKEESKKRRKDDDGEHMSSKHKKIDCSKSSKLSSNFPHYPMSERQQYALLKQMDDDSSNAGPSKEISETSSNLSGHSNDSSTYVLPDRKLHKRNAAGETLLIQMAKKGDLSAIKSLISDGANVNEQDYAGWSALHECSIRNYPQIAQYLLQHDADVHLCGLHGDTALHDAVKSNCSEVVKLLLRYGADPKKRNDKGVRPVDLAQSDEIRKIFHELSSLKEKRHKYSRESGSSLPEKSENKVKDPYAFEDEENMDSCKITPTKFSKKSQSWDEKDTQKTSPNLEPPEVTSDHSNCSPKVPPLRIKINQNQGDEPGAASVSTAKQKEQQPNRHSNPNSSDSDSSMLSIDITIKPSTKPTQPHVISKPCIFEDKDDNDNNSNTSNISVVKQEKAVKSEASTIDSEGKEESKSSDRRTSSNLSCVATSTTGNTTTISTNQMGRTLRSHTQQKEKINSHNQDESSDDKHGGGHEKDGSYQCSSSDYYGKSCDNNSNSSNNNNSSSNSNKSNNAPIKKRKFKRNSDTDKAAQSNSQQNKSHDENNRGSSETSSSTIEAITNNTNVSGSNTSTTNQNTTAGSVISSQIKSEETQNSTKGTNSSNLLDYQMIMSPYTTGNASTSPTVSSSNNYSQNSTGASQNITNYASIRWENPYRKAALASHTRHKLVTKLELVHPKPPIGFKDFLITTKQYLTQNQIVQGISKYAKRNVPVDIKRPELVHLFREQEERRYAQALKHQSEREHLRIVAEQEVIRAHCRAARQLAGQDNWPFSFCSVVTLENNAIDFVPSNQSHHTISNPVNNSFNRNYGGNKNSNTKENQSTERLSYEEFIKLLDSIKKKYETEKKHILSRQLHECESLCMLQRLEWEHKLNETITISAGSTSLLPPSNQICLNLEHIPMIEVPKDFVLFNIDPWPMVTT